MVNHARTLLLNRRNTELQSSWSEFVSDEFVPTALPTYLQKTWNVLFGLSPDAMMMNWRANQYMNVLASSEFYEYVTALDSRDTIPKTYKKITDDLPVIACSTSSNPAIFIGQPIDVPSLGRMGHNFRVVYSETPDVFTVNNIGLDTEVTYAATPSGSNYAKIPLGTSTVYFTTAVSPALTEGDEWLVELVATPSKSLVDIVNDLEKVSTEYMSQIMTASKEPYITFNRLWSDSRGFALKLTGFLLSWIYKHEEVRNAR